MKASEGYVQAQGMKIVNGAGKPFLLRGVGLGSWLLPEGYMWKMPPGIDRPRRIEGLIQNLLGEEESRRFWNRYRARYISREDILQIAQEGFNSVRVPINSRTLLEGESGYSWNREILSLLDRMIGWCREAGLYVILDLHGAPGGQTGTNIDDSENDAPELFTREENQRQTVEIWRMLASRYRDEKIIAGYDLLNEPLPDSFARYNSLVMPLYRRIIAAIREVDPHHMIILEGVHWATDWSIFTDLPDENVMLQFHKYWNNPDVESIRRYLDLRTSLDVPIFMGEGGENNTDWYSGAFRLFEDLDISWNFWTWKKMDTENSPCSIRKPGNWERLAGYGSESLKPEPGEVHKILSEYLENIEFSNCLYRQEVVSSLFRRPPVRIPAVFYSNLTEGTGFKINRFREGTTGFRRQDGTDIRFLQGDRGRASFEHGQGQAWQDDEWLGVTLEAGEWLVYDFSVLCGPAGESRCSLEFRLAVPEETAEITFFLDGLPFKTLGLTRGPAREIDVFRNLDLESPEHQLKVLIDSGSVTLEWMRVLPVPGEEAK